MADNRLYIDFHVIQTVPPSCVNRDDTGRPKTAVYGGANRARVSSQAWKHSMREMFKELVDNEKMGYRTKYIKQLIIENMCKLSPNGDKSKYDDAVDEIMKLKYKLNNKDHALFSFENSEKTKVLFFISNVQSIKFAEKVLEDIKRWQEKTTEDKKSKIKDIANVQEYRKILSDNPSIDLALFGRMAADDNDLNVDASAQVAHSISTHAVQNEYDYFTAVDDCSPADNAGAGHLGTMEFNSSTLYRYATVNAADLFKLIGEDTADAVKAFAQAFICSMPTGKQNSYANKTLPDMVYVTVRKDQPVNLCGAFEKPVYSKEGYAELSKEALFGYAQKLYEDYSDPPVCSFVLGHDAVLGAEKVDLSALVEKLHEYIANEVV